MRKQLPLFKLPLLAAALFFALFVNVANAAWSEPAQNPTGSNTPPPLNTGSENQVKTGGLFVGSLGTTGGASIGGNASVASGSWFLFNGSTDTNRGIANITGDGVQLKFWNFFDIFSSPLGSSIVRVLSNGNVGIGNTAPAQKLDVNGSVKGTGLCIGTDCRTSWPSSPANTVTGAGSASYVTKWSGLATVTNSLIYDNGINVGIGNTTPTQKLDVRGNVKGTGLCIGTDCKTSWPSGADNLGNHTATQYLQMGSQWINLNGGGLYSSGLGNYFWPSNSSYWVLRSNSGTQYQTNDGVLRGYVYQDSSNNFGLLASDGNWRIRTQPGYQELYGVTYMSDSRSGIYYDRDNTAYYVDPAGATSAVLSGNVGIGVTPSYKLDVYGPSGNYPARVASPSGYLAFGPGNTSWSHFTTDRPRFYFNTGITVDTGNVGSYSQDLNLQTSGTTRLTISNLTGNVGIGNTAPAQKLDVSGNVKGTGLCIGTDCRTSWPTSSGGTVTGSGTANYMPRWSSGSALANSVIYDTGINVGIGNTNPLSTLSVGGTGVFGAGIYGTGNTYGVYGNSVNYGVVGANMAAWGGLGYGSYGVYGNTNSASGYGVYGINSGASGTGVYGYGGTYGVVGATGGTGTTYGVYGGFPGPGFGATPTYGVYGNGTNTGVYGNGYTGVYGNGYTYGGYFIGPGFYVNGVFQSEPGTYGIYSIGDAYIEGKIRGASYGFGGMYGVSGRSVWNNPFTGSTTCPPGFTSQVVWNALLQNGTNTIYYCYK